MADYDRIADQYVARVPRDPWTSPTVEGLARATLLSALTDVSGQELLDLGCGEGHVARHLVARGAAVLGVDLSERLISF